EEFAVLLSGVSIVLLLAVWSLGLLVDWAAGFISPEMEAVIFSSMQLSGTPVFEKQENDPRRIELQRSVDELGSCNEVGYPLQVNIAKSKDANAFAFPGGRIIVLQGLLEKVHSENGLAFVLAHEMAHFKQRDHLRGMGRGLVLTALSALLTGAGSDLTTFIAPALGIGQARYSQQREASADKLALETLNCFYGHVGGADEFFQAMQEQGEKEGWKIGGYFASHPKAVQRINTLRTLTTAAGFTVKETTPLPLSLRPETSPE
ncbi:MAG: peptidase M48, partial [Candidatus Electrothrix sp. EH2]|nr:peptidase M48 [Candidatus Electrothrix sp. EH2]